MKTVAEQLGQTPHLSPLLRKLRFLGLASSDDLRRLAVERGCDHYRHPEDSVKRPLDARLKQISNLELAFAMISAAQNFDPLLVRCAAQLLSDEAISAEAIARYAERERAVPIVRYVAKAGVELDSEGREKWRRLLEIMPETPEIPEGKLPHRTRFVSMSGVSWANGRLIRFPRRIWLRPQPGHSDK